MDEMEPVDTSVELTGAALRNLVISCITTGNISLPVHAVDRMDERTVTGPQIEACLMRGALASESIVGTKWRYRATGRGVTVIFSFDTDEDGNVLVVITTWRNR